MNSIGREAWAHLQFFYSLEPVSPLDWAFVEVGQGRLAHRETSAWLLSCWDPVLTHFTPVFPFKIARTLKNAGPGLDPAQSLPSGCFPVSCVVTSCPHSKATMSHRVQPFPVGANWGIYAAPAKAEMGTVRAFQLPPNNSCCVFPFPFHF
jgi:hypothetical protein